MSRVLCAFCRGVAVLTDENLAKLLFLLVEVVAVLTQIPNLFPQFQHL